MKKLLSLFLFLCFIFSIFTACEKAESVTDGTADTDITATSTESADATVLGRPEPDSTEILTGSGSSFALTFNTYGVSSYDSETGKLVKTTDATHPEDYVTEFHMSEEQISEISALIRELDILSYPDEYQPTAALSEPHETLILSVRVGCEEKIVKCEEVAIGAEGCDDKAQAFLDVCERIQEIIYASEEWQALPAYEWLYE